MVAEGQPREVAEQWASVQEAIVSDLAMKANLGELQQVRKDVLSLSSDLHELLGMCVFAWRVLCVE